MPLLSLDRVTKRFWRGYRQIVALQDVSLEVEAGDFVALWGAGYSGKTTLLRVAAGIERPDEGAVLFDGRDLSSVSRRERARLLRETIGCVWGTVHATRGLSVIDHVALPLLDRDGHAAASRRAFELLERVGARDCARTQWRELSDGDRTRVAIAHALVRRPRLLLADEPTAKLGMVEREQVLSILRGLADEARVAILMSAPDAPDMLQSHRMLSLDAGRLISPRSEPHGKLIDFPGGDRTSTGQGG
jgi:putative ABC transport system ATP-binding protein